MRRMEFRITQKQFDSLLERHQVFGIPIAEQIRRAITEYLERHPRKFGSSKKGAKKRDVTKND